MKSIITHTNSWIVTLVTFTCLMSCQKKDSATSDQLMDYPIKAVDIRNIELKDSFWAPMMQQIQNTTIPYALEKCYEEGRFENFLVAGGKLEGKTRGEMPFDDSDPYKIIEGAAISLMSYPNPDLDKLLDSLIAIIAIGQEPDGYITTWQTIDPTKPPAPWVAVKEGKRWESLESSHELYNAGHMYEAAAAHYWATGKRNFLEIALKNADFVVKTFGDGPEQISAVPGHQIIETGLIQLYRITGKEDYLKMAKYFLDNRGNPENHELYGGYISTAHTQDHLHPTKQSEAVGHAVRAVYMYAAMTDVATLHNAADYQQAAEKIWSNMTFKKTYVTGGIGARQKGEAFGDNYELPNKTGYSETCAAIGSVCWNHRLFMQSGEVGYFDVIERTLYNGLIAGISLDGTKFFYPNSLESDGQYKFNRGTCTRQSWFDCSCCPTNLIRFLPSVPKYIYATHADTIYTNLYVANQATIKTESNEVAIDVETNYPWEGRLTFNIEPSNSNKVTYKFRVPGWVRNEPMPGDLYYYTSNRSAPKVKVNGSEISSEIVDGYIVITEGLHEGGSVDIEFPMEVKTLMTNKIVDENKNKVALEYGPLIYAIEAADNPNFDEIIFDSQEDFNVEMKSDLLGGVNTLTSNSLTAIPYFRWSNRGVGKMKVWIDQK